MLDGAQRYLLSGLIALVTLAAGLVLLTAIVDPYYEFGAHRFAGFNQLKPRAYEQVDIAKSMQLERNAANTLVLGNSRVEIGIDPASEVFPVEARPVFNAAVAGRTTFTALRLLEDAIAVHPPKTIIVGLDFPDYLRAQQVADASDPPISAFDRRMRVDRSGHSNRDWPWQRALDKLTASLTIGAVLDSVQTVFDQDPGHSATMTTLGFNPLHEYRQEVRNVGEQVLFAQKDATYRAEYEGYVPTTFQDVALNREFQEFRTLLGIAAKAHIRVELIIYPYHVHYLEMIHQLGFWDTFRAWQRAIVRVVEDQRQRSGVDARLWDFSGYNEISEEKIPPPGDRHTEMQWYWEAGHFKSALGDKILAALYGKERDFGSEIDPESLTEHLTVMDQRRAAFVARPDGG